MSLPLFLEFRFFRGMCVLAIVLLASLLHQLRVRYIVLQIRQGCRFSLFEQMRVAREMHDLLLQGMHALVLQLHFVLASLNVDDPRREVLATALERAEGLTEQARTQLQSLARAVNVAESLSQELAQMVNDLGLKIPEVRVNQYGRERTLRPLVKMTIYSSIREGLTNALDHAHASRVELDLEFGVCEFSVRFRDDGIGITNDAERKEERGELSGLRRMRESILAIGGQLDVWSAPGAGTEIEIYVPASAAY